MSDTSTTPPLTIPNAGLRPARVAVLVLDDSGTVTATNDELKNAPDKINETPHEAWIIKVELSDPAQFDGLLDAAAYEAFIAEES